MIKPPKRLKNEAKKEWNRLANSLIDLGYLTELDVEAFALYCETHQDYLRYRELIDNDAMAGIAVSEKGGQYQTATLNAMYMALDRKSKLGQRFGLDPESREKIKTPKQITGTRQNFLNGK